MEITLEKGIDFKLSGLIEKFKLSNAQDSIMKMLQNVPESMPAYYIGEYNKTDVMF